MSLDNYDFTEWKMTIIDDDDSNKTGNMQQKVPNTSSFIFKNSKMLCNLTSRTYQFEIISELHLLIPEIQFCLDQDIVIICQVM